MVEAIKELNDALTLLSTLSVSGEAVDVMAVAKAKLRKVKAELEKLEKEDTPDG